MMGKRSLWWPGSQQAYSRRYLQLANGTLIIQSSFALFPEKERGTFPHPTVDVLFSQFFEVLSRSKRQAESCPVYLCNRLEHIHILFAHRTNISLGMRPRQQNRTRQGRPSGWPPEPQGHMELFSPISSSLHSVLHTPVSVR